MCSVWEKRAALTSPAKAGSENKRGIAALKALRYRKSSALIRVAVLAADRPDSGLIFFERVDVNHPVEYHGMEGSTGGIAGFLCGDRSPQTKLRMGDQIFVLSSGRRRAEIHVFVPLRDAQR